MARRTITVEAPTNATPNTEDCFFRMTPGASGGANQPSRFRICVVDAPNGAVIKGRMVLMSTDGSGSTSTTPIRRDPEARTVAGTYAIKNGSTAFTPGTVTQVIDSFSFNDRDFYEWINPISEPFNNSRWGVLLQCNIASVNVRVSCDSEE